MAPEKRPAEPSSDDSSDNVSSTPPSSSSRKRRRISDGSLTTPENPHDEGISSEEDVEEAQAATQAYQDRISRTRHGPHQEPATCGVLKQVEIRDFMCHRHFTYELGPQINFVCGKNGSGKSAILTALIICLGGKASATNRGQSLKSLIRHGAEQATIICRIKNEGDGAYMPEDYGDFIDVERYFSKHSASGYKIKNERGRIVSTKKADLDAMLDHFSLQMDNPLNILSQDQARQFIGASNTAEKYKFFVKGVQLEQLDQDYKLLEEQLNMMNSRLQRTEEDLKSLERSMENAKAKADLLKKREGLRDKVRDLRRQVTWVQVRDQEHRILECDQNIAEKDDKIAERQREVDEQDAKYQSADAENENARETLGQSAARLNEEDSKKHELQEAVDEARQEVTNANTETRGIRDAIQAKQREILKHESEMQQEEARLLESNGGGAARRLIALQEAKEAVESVKHDRDEHTRSRQASEDAVISSKKAAEERKHQRNLAKEETDRQRNRLDDLRNRKHQENSGFRPNTDKLLKEIERETRWTRKPIGPLGKHVRLTRPEWSSVIERVLGGNLNSFLVFNKRDADILGTLKNRVKCDADHIIINDQPLVPNEPDAKFDTILRVLDVENEHVQKALIIQCAIEQHILVADVNEATNTMYDQGRLRHVRGCYAFSPGNKRRGILLRYTPNGEPAQDPVAEWIQHSRMQSDSEAAIRAQETAVNEASSQQVTMQESMTRAQAAAVKAEQAFTRWKKRAHELKIGVEKAEDDVERLENEVNADNVESGRLDTLRAELRRAREEKALIEEQYKDAVLAQDSKKTVMRERDQALREFDQVNESLQQQHATDKDRARRADQKRSYELNEKNNAIARMEEARVDKVKAEEEKQLMEHNLADFIEQARTISERVNIPDDASHESLVHKYTQMHAEYVRFRNQQGMSLAEATEAALKATNAFKEATKEHYSHTELSNMLREALDQRKERWRRFRHFISLRARISFTHLLSQRGFRGTLLISHKDRLMDLTVEPDINRRSAAGRGAKTLSGGEKSFSQICLLLAIWEAMGSPIRCLDEFDVYMDAVNRNMSVKMIIEAARDSSGKQYVLISPGSKDDIPVSEDVKTQTLHPPERNQTTIT